MVEKRWRKQGFGVPYSKFFLLRGSQPCHSEGVCITQWSYESWRAGPPKMNRSILKEINPEYSLEGRTDAEALILWPPDSKSWLIEKDPDAGENRRQKKKRVAEDEMVRYHHWLNGHAFKETLGDSEGQGSLACCTPWGHKESDMT